MFKSGLDIADETGSEERFDQRLRRQALLGRPLKFHYFWWFVHNCVAHLLIGVIPIKLFFDFHDYTSRKINT